MNRSLWDRVAEQEGQNTEGMARTKMERPDKAKCVVSLAGVWRLMWLEGGPVAGVVDDKLGGKLLASWSHAEGIGFICLGPWGLSETLDSWGGYVGPSQRELLTPQLSTLSFHAGDEVCAEPVWDLSACPGHLGLLIIIQHWPELQPLPTCLPPSRNWLSKGGGRCGLWDEEGDGRGWAFHTLGSLLASILICFFRSWLLPSSKYTAILASSPGGRRRKNFLPSAPLWK